MPTIQHLLQRWGFVKLRRYGLELTSDGRILSTRPAMLDDGTGHPIVGWQDGDVAIWKLSRWSGTPGMGPAVTRGSGEPRAVVPPGPLPIAKPVIPASSEAQVAPVAAAAAPSRPSARVMRADVAGEPTVDEDDWEWTIALARARVAVEEAETARPPAPRPEPPAPRLPERPTLRSSATADLAASGDWRKTDTSDTIEAAIEAAAYEDYRISTRPAISLPRIAPKGPTTAPGTVIPVPSLPTVDATRRARLEPVVRTAPSTPVNRLAKGTGPVDPPMLRRTRPAAVVVEDTVPNLSIGDRTRPGVAPATRRMAAAPGGELDDTGEVAPPPSGDRTRPGIALPAAARAVELPSIKRRTAR